MLTHFDFTQPKYLFYSNAEGGYIVDKGGHLQYRQFWSQSDPYFLCHRNHPWAMPFQNIYGLWGPSLIVLEKNENRQTDRQTRQIYIERDFQQRSNLRKHLLVGWLYCMIVSGAQELLNLGRKSYYLIIFKKKEKED